MAGPSDELDHAFGDDGDWLHDWFLAPEREIGRPDQREPGV